MKPWVKVLFAIITLPGCSTPGTNPLAQEIEHRWVLRQVREMDRAVKGIVFYPTGK